MATLDFLGQFAELSGIGRIILLGTGLLAGSAVGLVCIWTIRSRVHWLLRVAVGTACILSPAVAGGWDLVFVFLVQSTLFLGLAIPYVRYAAHRASSVSTSRSQRAFQDTSRNRILFGTQVVALGCMIVPSVLFFCMPPDVWKIWKSLGAFGVALGLATLLAYRVAFAATSNTSRLGAAVLCPLAAPMIGFLSLLTAAHNFAHERGGVYAERRKELSGIRWACLRLVQAATIVGGVLMVAPPAMLFLWILPRVWAAPVKTINASDYDFLIVQGNRLQGVVPRSDAADEDELQVFLSQHGALLIAVGRCLGSVQEAEPPQLKYDATTRSESFRQLANAFVAKEALARRRRHAVDAADSCLEVVRLGQAAALGGSVFDLMIGLNIQGVGMERLRVALAAMRVTERRRLARMLNGVLQHQEPIETVIERDLAWGSRPFVWRAHALDAALKVTAQELPRLRNLKEICTRLMVEQRQLANELAAMGDSASSGNGKEVRDGGGSF